MFGGGTMTKSDGNHFLEQLASHHHAEGSQTPSILAWSLEAL